MSVAVGIDPQDDARNRIEVALMVLSERCAYHETLGNPDPALEVCVILLRGALDRIH